MKFDFDYAFFNCPNELCDWVNSNKNKITIVSVTESDSGFKVFYWKQS